ncbi:hypothetical protein [Rhodopseudomonas sp. B29]|nr:hypothetical protein [Rhodopseudomonas sp. B29]
MTMQLGNSLVRGLTGFSDPAVPGWQLKLKAKAVDLLNPITN